MVLSREYRVCMPLTLEEYKVGQLYMIARHSFEQSGDGEGVEIIENKECEDPERGKGQYTEKHIHLSSRLPYWLQAICPRVFYVIEKSWNYYPYTITEYACSFIPKFGISIQTKYENDNGCQENCLDLPPEKLAERSVDHIDIAFDDVTKHYKREEDPKFFRSEKTNRGPLIEGWRDDKPIMCSYKLVNASFEVWGFQTRVEDFIQRCIRDVLLLGHRQAFTWIDEWIDMSMDDVREYERYLHEETNRKIAMKRSGSTLSVKSNEPTSPTTPTTPTSPTAIPAEESDSVAEGKPASEQDVQLIEANQ